MREITAVRLALVEYQGILAGISSQELRNVVDAYLEQVQRLLSQAEEADGRTRDLDIELLLISAERWLWKAAKTCSLYENCPLTGRASA